MFKNNKRNFAIILVVAFIVMFWSFKSDYKNIIKLFSNIQVGWLFMALIVIAIYHLVEAYFIYYYCKKKTKKYTFFQAFQAQQAGVFFSAITPFSSGGQFAQVMVFSKQNINTKLSASMLMISFISWQAVLVVFGALALVFNYAELSAKYSAFFNLVFLGFGINLVVIVGLFLMAFSKGFHKFIFDKIVPLLGRLRIIKDVESRKVSTQQWLQLFRDEFNDMLLHKNIMFQRFLTDFIKIMALYSIPFFAARALNIHVPLDDFGMSIILTAFVYMIIAFVPLPGGAGGSEGTFVLLLGPLFGAATTSVMLLWRVCTYYLGMLVSFFVFANIKELAQSREELKKKNKEEKELKAKE